MSLDYKKFAGYCVKMKLKELLDSHLKSDSFKDNIESFDNIFDFSVPEQDNKLWQQYRNYRDSIKEIHQLSPSKSIDDLIDPHKVASCITLSILQLKPFTLKQNINLVSDPLPMGGFGVNLLVNESLSCYIGLKFLKMAMIYSFKFDDVKKDIVLNQQIIFPNVNRYDFDKNANTYIDYMFYFLKNISDSGSNEKYSKQNLLTLAHIYNNIESYHYLMLSVNCKVESCIKVCKSDNYKGMTTHFNTI